MDLGFFSDSELATLIDVLEDGIDLNLTKYCGSMRYASSEARKYCVRSKYALQFWWSMTRTSSHTNLGTTYNYVSTCILKFYCFVHDALQNPCILQFISLLSVISCFKNLLPNSLFSSWQKHFCTKRMTLSR